MAETAGPSTQASTQRLLPGTAGSSSFSSSSRPSQYTSALSTPLSDLLPPKTLAHARRNGLFSVAQLVLLSSGQCREMLRLDTVGDVGAWRADIIKRAYGGGDLDIGVSSEPNEEEGDESCKKHDQPMTRSVGTKLAQRKKSRVDGPAQEMRDGISLGDPQLDKALGTSRVIRRGMITEIVGESSCGKSQLAMQLAVECALGEEETGAEAGSVAMLLSEGDAQATSFVRRMVQMAEARGGRDEQQARVAQLLANTHVASIRDLEALEHAIEYTLPGLACRLLDEQREQDHDAHSKTRPPLRLIILDNIAALFSDAETSKNMSNLLTRSRWSCLVADGLKRLTQVGASVGEESAIVVVNHVTDSFERDLPPIQRVVDAEERQMTRGQESVDRQVYGEPPLTYSVQSPYFSGLLASLRVEPMHRQINNDDEKEWAQIGVHRPLSLLFGYIAKQAALGSVWNNCINARIMVTRAYALQAPTQVNDFHEPPRARPLGVRAKRDEKGKQDACQRSSQRTGERILPLRRLSVIFSPCTPPRSARFVVDRRGVSFIAEDDSSISPMPDELPDESEEEEEGSQRGLPDEFRGGDLESGGEELLAATMAAEAAHQKA